VLADKVKSRLTFKVRLAQRNHETTDTDSACAGTPRYVPLLR
jgi:hypothetical protein